MTLISVTSLPSVFFILVLASFLQLVTPQPAECYDAPNGSPTRGLPLCGNGVLDAGEICDDGNQINFDGCNAFCSAFDAMAAASTLAGGARSSFFWMFLFVLLVHRWLPPGRNGGMPQRQDSGSRRHHEPGAVLQLACGGHCVGWLLRRFGGRRHAPPL